MIQLREETLGLKRDQDFLLKQEVQQFDLYQIKLERPTFSELFFLSDS